MKIFVNILVFYTISSLVYGFEYNLDFLYKKLLSNFFDDVTSGLSPYQYLTTTQIIESFGYKAESHHVITEDGYILELHRIPHGINDTSTRKRPIAFLQHCLECSSSDWVMDKPDRALAFLLADGGYDVWMNNVRGNTYSRKHTTLNPDVDKREFWEFTWGDMALYDATAAIDYALNTTGNTEVYYVGFSMGTTIFFALMSEKPEYAAKIKAAALMGPVAYVENIKGPLRLLANYSNDLDTLFGLMGYYEFLPSSPVMDYLAENFCGVDDKLSPICQNILFLICGFDEEELNKDYLPIYLSHTPAGTSIHTVNHYAQLVPKGIFQMYDWGPIGNKKHYGQKEPPIYNLQVDTPPIAFYWGQNDWLADPKDVARLSYELKNVVVNQRVKHDQWNHMDFVWGIHAKEYVYEYLMDFLSKY